MTPIVLFGGLSDERHVSVASGQNVVRNLDAPLCWFWAPNGAVHDVAAGEMLAHQNPFLADYVPSRPAIWPDLEQALDTLPVEDPVFVLALHGGEGEDGTVQRMMEERGLAFTGSDSEASAIALDKHRAKEKVRQRGGRVAESRVAEPDEFADAVREMLERYERVVAKPRSGGSSRGLFFLSRGDAMPEVTGSYIIEEFIAGRELTVGVVESTALPVLEIETDPGRDFDYEGKYLGRGTREICPAQIPDELRDAAQRAAVIAHEAIGCSGYSRTDLVGSDRGVWFIELNTLPGLTTASLLPKELGAAGVSMREFLDRQITLAAQRRSRGRRAPR